MLFKVALYMLVVERGGERSVVVVVVVVETVDFPSSNEHL